MTIGLTALVERYLIERRTLGFQLLSPAYSLRSLAEYVRRTRHRGPLTLEVMAEWARLDSHASVDPRTWAMHLLQSGVPFNIIALWLGHESTNTTHRYVEANLEMKEKALARLEAPDIKLQRFKASDDLMKFLRSL